MRTIPFDNTTGTWVRLVYNTATIALDRWPGPHRPGTAIYTTGAGGFVFDHHDHGAGNGPEAVYIWTPTN